MNQLNDNETLIYADTDTQFFGNPEKQLLNELGDYDVAFQDDMYKNYCAGFFVCKKNERVIFLFSEIEKLLRQSLSANNDQDVLNNVIRKFDVKHKFLSHRFFTIGHITNKKLWNGEFIEVPKDVLVHHANWMVGLENKIRLLDMVRNQLNQSTGISILVPYCYDPQTKYMSKFATPFVRPTAVIDFAKAVDETTKNPQKVEIVFGIHKDDLETRKQVEALSLNISVRYVFIEQRKDNNINLSYMWNQVYQHAKYDIVGFFGDDVIFKTSGWDIEVEKEFIKDKYIMISCNDVTFHHGNESVLFFTHKAMHNALGFYLKEKYRRWFMDLFWDRLYRRIGKLHYREDIVTEHINPLIKIADASKNMQDLIRGDQREWFKSDNEINECILKLASLDIFQKQIVYKAIKSFDLNGKTVPVNGIVVLDNELNTKFPVINVFEKKNDFTTNNIHYKHFLDCIGQFWFDKKIDVKNVTLLCADCVNPQLGAYALAMSMRGIKWEAVKLLSDVKPEWLPFGAEWVQIPKLDTISSYNVFVLSELHKYVDTKHVLTVQSDGWVLRPNKWSFDWLKYDYIGAPWSKDIAYHKSFCVAVGNSGFCLRSHRMLVTTAKLVPEKLKFYFNLQRIDDDGFCAQFRKEIEDAGCIFSTPEIAATFSYDADCQWTVSDSFGYHGWGTRRANRWLIQDLVHFGLLLKNNES